MLLILEVVSMKKLIVISALILCSLVGYNTENMKSEIYTIVPEEHECTNIVKEITKEPECLKEGIFIDKCSECGKILDSGTIPELGHNFVDSVCSRCWETNPIDEKSKTVILSSEECQQFIYGNSVVIPSEYNGYRVVGISTAAFYQNDSIESVNLPETLRYIGMWAFGDCTNLKSINLENVEYFGYASFQCCYGLGSIDLSSAKYIGNYAFNHLTGLDQEVIELPSSLETIGMENLYSAHNFYDCGSGNFTAYSGGSSSCPVQDGILYNDNGRCLVSIPCGKEFENNVFAMPDTVESLGELSFSRNMNIREVVISNNLVVNKDLLAKERSQYQNDGNELSVAIYGYSPVERYSVKSGNSRYTSRDGILYSKDLEEVIAVPNQYKGEIVIPDGVSYWRKNALWSDGVDYFKDQILNHISRVYIPSSLTSIDSTQIETLNLLHDYYGTIIEVSSDNTVYKINSNGHLYS